MVRLNKKKIVLLGLVACVIVIMFQNSFLWLDPYLGQHIGNFDYFERAAANPVEMFNSEDFRNVSESRLLEPLSEQAIEDVKREIELLNTEQKIHNLHKFGPLTPSTAVLVILVHSRIQHLSLLLESISGARGIEDALLIFSHDIFNAEFNDAISKIKFARVLQIFFPYSMQLHPERFPGQSPNDCPKDIGQKKAREIGCGNAEFPDKYGNYREAWFTQLKHHWWWKTNFVFSRIKALEKFQKSVIFLEEDYYLTPDFLWMLKLMEAEMSAGTCGGCGALALGKGTYDDKADLPDWNMSSNASTSDQVVVANWLTDNNGRAFNRTLWTRIQTCSEAFCKYDDYNYDWSLIHIVDHCLTPSPPVLYPKTTRLFHLGKCGTHFKSKECDPVSFKREIDDELSRHEEALFPSSLNISIVQSGLEAPAGARKAWGGWADPRDHALCLSFNFQD